MREQGIYKALAIGLFFAIHFSVIGYHSAKENSVLSSDSTKNEKACCEDELKKDERKSSLRFYYLFLPQASLNYERFNLISDHTGNKDQYKFNSAIQQHFDQSPNLYQSPILNQVEYLNASNFDFHNDFGNIGAKDIYYGVLRANLVNLKSEKNIGYLVTSATQELLKNGMDNLSTDILPFITMLMNEQHEYHYDDDRAISTKPTAKGIVTTIEMLNTMGTLDANNKLGVCRDTHDMGLRIARHMYQLYLDEKYPGKNYNVDDYVFLQAWVTPSSQHVTLVVIDPENPRNFHELDWGRVIEKKDQEGVEIGKMVGTAIRLWKYDEKENVTKAFTLLRSTWGSFFDNELLSADEQWSINGIFTPQYRSGASYRLDFGKNENNTAVISTGLMNAGEQYISGTIRTRKHSQKIAKLLNYEGFAGWQSMYIEDKRRKSKTINWVDWERSSNLITSIRYISELSIKKINVLPNISFAVYGRSQLEAFLTMSYFNTDHEDFDSRLYKSGDGNIWTTWGGELLFESGSKLFKSKLNYNDRNFLIPSEIRLLSPNPFVLVENATVVKSGRGIQSQTNYSTSIGDFELDFRYEQDPLRSRFIYSSLEYKKLLKKKVEISSTVGYFSQIAGIEYYWYYKDRTWFSSSINLPNTLTTFSLAIENIGSGDFSFGMSISKSF